MSNIEPLLPKSDKLLPTRLKTLSTLLCLLNSWETGALFIGLIFIALSGAIAPILFFLLARLVDSLVETDDKKAEDFALYLLPLAAAAFLITFVSTAYIRYIERRVT